MFPYVFLDAVLLVLLNKWSLYMYIHTCMVQPASQTEPTVLLQYLSMGSAFVSSSVEA